MSTKITLGPALTTAGPAQSQNGHPVAVPGGFDTSKQFGGGLGSIDSVRKELDDAFADMKEFHNTEPDEVLRYCAGHSARISEIRMLIQRVEVLHRQWKPIRTQEVEVCLGELETQFKIASRLISMRELDWRMAGGSAT